MTPGTPMKTISIITPVYNEEVNIEECYRQVTNLFNTTLSQYALEHIWCDNASTDRSPEILRRLAKSDKRVKVIFNSRNFGIMRSTFNGLKSANGDGIVVFFPADLQDPVSVISQFVEKWEQGYEVVHGKRKNRVEGFIGSKIKLFYYRILSIFSEIEIPQNVSIFQFIDRKVLHALCEHEDSNPHISNLIANCGFRTIPVYYEWLPRARGKAKNRIFDQLDQALNSLISFSKAPMRIVLASGFGISFLSVLYALYTLLVTVYVRSQGGEVASVGIPTVIVALFFLSGIQLFILGVLGEYIAAIHFQVRKRPMVVERERLNFN